MNKDKYIALIISKLNNNISSENEILLNNWLNESIENKDIFEETSIVWNDADVYEPIVDNNKNSIWDNIQLEIDKEETVIKVIPIQKKMTWLKLVATIIILFSTGVIMNNYLNSNIISIETALNETKNIVLPDNSTIYLNGNSKISYAKKFKTRKITLEGEAFFDVTKDESNPFSVETKNTETFVLGTSFNVLSKGNKIEVSLFTGKIKFVANNTSTVLNPGDKILYNNQSKVLSEIEFISKNENSWNTKKLYFKNTKLEDAVSDISKFYNKEINIPEFSNLDCLFTGTFENKDLKEVLEAISFSFGTEYTIENNIIYFNTLDCN